MYRFSLTLFISKPFATRTSSLCTFPNFQRTYFLTTLIYFNKIYYYKVLPLDLPWLRHGMQCTRFGITV